MFLDAGMDLIDRVFRIMIAAYLVYNGFVILSNIDNFVEFGKQKNLYMAELSVRMAGILLLLSGISQLLSRNIADVGLCYFIVFCIIILITIHPFWKRTEIGEVVSKIGLIGMNGYIIVN